MSLIKLAKITVKDIHNLADLKNIKWDNNPKFMKWTKKLTGSKHLDDLSQEKLKLIKDNLISYKN